MTDPQRVRLDAERTVAEPHHNRCNSNTGMECDCFKRHWAYTIAEDYIRVDDALQRWLAWSGGDYPDDSPGDVISANMDGTIVLDDGITTWNPLRALAWFKTKVAGKRVLAQIADPSYVGNFSDQVVIDIYRTWARNALDASRALTEQEER